MDYFGVINEEDSQVPTFNEFPGSPYTTFDPNMLPMGFGCAEPGCKNKESSFGTNALPFCDCNPICMKRNIEYLSLQNAKLKGEINAMEFILSKYSLVSTKKEELSILMDSSQ